MESYAFKDCISLKTVTIASGSNTIGRGAFYNCSSLTSISIPESVIFIGAKKLNDSDLRDSQVFYNHPSSLVIYGVSNSFAHEFANANEITFRTVKEPTSITLSKTSLSLAVGSSQTITATVNPSDATDKTVTWTSSKTSVATVSNGKITAKAAGTATITAKTVNGKTATCKVTVTAPLATPVVSVSNSATGLKASWSAVSNATSYEVHYKASTDSDWTKATTTGTTYVITEAVSGKLYYVKVKAVSGSVKSDSSETKSLTYIACPTVSSLSYSNNAVNAKWGKIGGATRYQVAYKKNGASSFTTVTTANNTFELSNVDAGTSYIVKVRAQLVKDGSTTSGEWSAEKAVVTLAKPAVTAVRLSSDGTGIYTSWKAVSGATKYRVYYKLSTASTWSTKVTSSLSYTIKNVTKGKVYNVRICAACDAGGGALSPVQSVAILDAPTVTAKVSSNKTGIYTTWNSVTGADKYVVYYRKSGVSSWTVHETSNLTYTLKNLTSGATYQIKVAAMKEDGIGPFSATQSVVFK